jgi:hypothetical protein
MMRSITFVDGSKLILSGKILTGVDTEFNKVIYTCIGKTKAEAKMFYNNEIRKCKEEGMMEDVSADADASYTPLDTKKQNQLT